MRSAWLSPTDARRDRFERRVIGPILSRSSHDPYSLSYPYVVPLADGWRMFYGSHRGPGLSVADARHALTFATSADGLRWLPTGVDVLVPEDGELALTRPWLFERGGHEFMLFSIRRDRYTIGLARLAQLRALGTGVFGFLWSLRG